jgi:hypothetical protein
MSKLGGVFTRNKRHAVGDDSQSSVSADDNSYKARENLRKRRNGAPSEIGRLSNCLSNSFASGSVLLNESRTWQTYESSCLDPRVSQIDRDGDNAEQRSNVADLNGQVRTEYQTNMGNGASASRLLSNSTKSLDNEKILRNPSAIPDLEYELQQRDGIIKHHRIELDELKLLLQEKEEEIDKLRGEVHKLKSVLQLTVHQDGRPDILSTIHEEAFMVGQEARSKKQGVSGESTNVSGGGGSIKIKHFEKDFRYDLRKNVLIFIFEDMVCNLQMQAFQYHARCSDFES